MSVGFLLRTRYPCCGGRATFNATFFVNRETYERRCSRCGARYEVERHTLRATDNDPAGRIDQLDWVRVAGTNAVRAGSETFQRSNRLLEEEANMRLRQP